MSAERIDKILSHEGFGTRKDVKKLLHSGVVKVNGNKISDPGFHADTEKDEIYVDDELISVQKELYLMMNKPSGVVCANKDGLHETVFSLLEDTFRTGYYAERLHLIGRLDLDTEGFLILTTDGALTHRLISPKSHCTKKYFVRLVSPVDSVMRAAYEKEIKAGIHIPPEGNEPDVDCLPALVEWNENADEAYLSITEGKYHQVKRMFRALGNEVIYLKRVSIGSVLLDPSLGLGQYRQMSPEEVRDLEIE